MPNSVTNAKVVYFNAVANSWDTWEQRDPSALSRLEQGLGQFDIGPDEVVVDIGCGTGNLTRALLGQLSSKGRVIAVDMASQMVDVARRKIADGRVVWYVADAAKLPLPNDSVDRVICFSVWPHFHDAPACAMEFQRVLLPGGRLHVWHLLPRGRIDMIHASAGEAVRSDTLLPGNDLAKLLAQAGFQVQTVIDNEERYLVNATKPGT